MILYHVGSGHILWSTDTTGVNLINVLHKAFKHADPKTTKKTDNLTFLRIWDL